MVPVDYSRPLEAVIPGTAGKVLGVLARTHVELPIRRVAQLAGVSRDRASIEIRRLVVLGVVSRREVAGASLVKLERTNAAALALLALADAQARNNDPQAARRTLTVLLLPTVEAKLRAQAEELLQQITGSK